MAWRRNSRYVVHHGCIAPKPSPVDGVYALVLFDHAAGLAHPPSLLVCASRGMLMH